MWPKLCGKRFHSGIADHRDLAPHLAEDLVDARAAGRVVLGVQAEVEQRELDLAQRGEAGLEAARAQQLRDLLVGQRRAGLDVRAISSRSTSGCQA